MPENILLLKRNVDEWKGKTTTTERMLYYSGYTRRIGSRLSIKFQFVLVPSVTKLHHLTLVIDIPGEHKHNP